MGKTVKILLAGVLIMSSILGVQHLIDDQQGGKFANQDPGFRQSTNIVEILRAYWRLDRDSPKPDFELPVHSISKQSLEEETQDVVYRLGHSSLLLKINGELILTDPVFSDRASPVQFAGPKRFHNTPISITELPQVDTVVISHDHYDHLDKRAVKKLAAKTTRFLVPLRIGKRLVDWGVPSEKITEFAWWDSVTVAGVEYVFTPTQHFSGRGLFDGNTTLWGSWVIRSQHTKVFFSGDSGYFDGFKTIGDKYGPFDLTFIETGAYNELWSNIHMFPAQSVQAHQDLKGKVMLPIHNSTFDLAMHNWQEPLEQALSISNDRGVTMVSPEVGQRMEIQAPLPLNTWWRKG